jgi:hypothetical protein
MSFFEDVGRANLIGTMNQAITGMENIQDMQLKEQAVKDRQLQSQSLQYELDKQKREADDLKTLRPLSSIYPGYKDNPEEANILIDTIKKSGRTPTITDAGIYVDGDTVRWLNKTQKENHELQGNLLASRIDTLQNRVQKANDILEQEKEKDKGPGDTSFDKAKAMVDRLEQQYTAAINQGQKMKEYILQQTAKINLEKQAKLEEIAAANKYKTHNLAAFPAEYKAIAMDKNFDLETPEGIEGFKAYIATPGGQQDLRTRQDKTNQLLRSVLTQELGREPTDSELYARKRKDEAEQVGSKSGATEAGKLGAQKGLITPESMESAYQYMKKSGEFPPEMNRTLFRIPGAQVELTNYINKRQIEEGITGGDRVVQKAIFGSDKNSLNNTTKAMDSVKTFESGATQSLNLLEKVADKYKRGQYPKANQFSQIFTYHTGDPDIKPFQNALTTAMTEYMKVINAGSNVTATELSVMGQQRAKDLLATSDNAETLKNSIDLMRKEMKISGDKFANQREEIKRRMGEENIESKAEQPSIKNNNPLNIKSGAGTKYLLDSGYADIGSTAKDGGNFLKFKSDAEGLDAAKKYLFMSDTYKNLTVDAAMKKWSNNGYGGEVAPAIKNKPISSLNAQEQNMLVQGMLKAEGSSVESLVDKGKTYTYTTSSGKKATATQADIDATALKYNLTAEQVKKKLGIKG